MKVVERTAGTKDIILTKHIEYNRALPRILDMKLISILLKFRKF